MMTNSEPDFPFVLVAGMSLLGLLMVPVIGLWPLVCFGAGSAVAYSVVKQVTKP